MLELHFRQVWDQLRAKKPEYRHFLDALTLRGLRGIREISLPFAYPVCVLAGQNGCGKTTVLHALACAYGAPDSGGRRASPALLFPDFRPRSPDLPGDTSGPRSMLFRCTHGSQAGVIEWHGTPGGWRRSVADFTLDDLPAPGMAFDSDAVGPEGAPWHRRPVSLRSLRSLTNPSEGGRARALSTARLEARVVDAEFVVFAHQVLPYRYSSLLQLAGRDRDLLYATRADGAAYSEFHMSAGERTVLRLSHEVAGLRDALVLIDEVETGLHPHLQQLLMLQLQRLALRSELQFVVTTHSPVVLDAVPPEARLFLERSNGEVVRRTAYRDVVQRVLYGQSFDRLTILCEDEAAEAVVRGVFDLLKPRLGWLDEDVEIGRDTGKSEFAGYVRAFAKLRRLESLLFVLDGDARDEEAAVREAARREGQPLTLLFLPSDSAPEEWVWQRLRADAPAFATLFGVEPASFERDLDAIARSFLGATDKPANIAKGRLTTLARALTRDRAEICRAVTRHVLESGAADLLEFAREVEKAVESWRRLRG